jgi:AraC family transcriptional regulator
MSQIVDAKSGRVYREDTLEDYHRDVIRAVEVMCDRLGEPLAVDDLADTALLSRFHFTRVFSKVTGVSPARFLAAVRMQEAKRLLLKTDRSVTEICFDVGYNSLGTFTRIFADFVGFSPERFRQLSNLVVKLSFAQAIAYVAHRSQRNSESSISVEVTCSHPVDFVTAALFPHASPRSNPIDCACSSRTMRFLLNRRVAINTYLFAVGLERNATIEDALLTTNSKVFVGSGCLTVYSPIAEIMIELRPKLAIEPPLVFAYPLVMLETARSKFGDF